MGERHKRERGGVGDAVLRDAVCCSVLQCVAVCCSVLQCVAVCCSVLQCERDSIDERHKREQGRCCF